MTSYLDLLYAAIDPRSRLRASDFEGSAAPATRPASALEPVRERALEV
jgi:hypothetical protein